MKIAKACVCCGSRQLARSPAILMPFVAERVFGWVPAEITAEWGLRDIGTGRAEALCSTLLCGQCGLVFLDMRFDDEEMAALYADYRGPDYRRTRVRYEPDYGRRNDLLNEGSPYIAEIEAFLAPHLPSRPAVLDWGGDTGMNTPFRGRAAAHDVFEISGKPPIVGARAVDRREVAGSRYDLIVSSNVLEHVPYPADVLADMVSAMAAGTVLYLEVPHEDLVQHVPDASERAARKRHWHEHINFFTPASLRAMAEAAGLAIVDLRSQPIVAGGLPKQVFCLAARLRQSHAAAA